MRRAIGPEHRKHQLKVLERQKQVAAFSLRGLTFAQIGEKLGMSHSQAFRDWHDWYGRTEAKDLAKSRREATARMDAAFAKLQDLIDAHSSAALEGDVDASRIVADCVAKQARIEERRAKVLGLDAAEKHELTGKDGSPLAPLVFLPLEREPSAPREELEAAGQGPGGLVP
jgi:hypothetical protein